MSLPPHEPVPGFAELGFVAFTTSRDAGSYNLGGSEPVAEVSGRWTGLLASLGTEVHRLACAHQVHGDRVLLHGDSWSGWLRDTAGADGHLTRCSGTSMAVTLADCVPIFLAHPAGVFGVLHSGWKGTAAGIVSRAIEMVQRFGLSAADLRVHLGPAICGKCYEVGPEVFAQITGRTVEVPTPVDLRAVIAMQAERTGARVSVSGSCTRCNNDRFFSHRAGDSGRQVGVISAPVRPKRA
jgi:YfiH family protein